MNICFVMALYRRKSIIYFLFNTGIAAGAK
jgi:hypothetical protein